jgi:hypothetical protein
LRIAFMPTIYFSTMRRLVRENDLIMLVEGSTYMDTWTSAMLWCYLWATHCADDRGTSFTTTNVVGRRYQARRKGE